METTARSPSALRPLTRRRTDRAGRWRRRRCSPSRRSSALGCSSPSSRSGADSCCRRTAAVPPCGARARSSSRCADARVRVQPRHDHPAPAPGAGVAAPRGARGAAPGAPRGAPDGRRPGTSTRRRLAAAQPRGDDRAAVRGARDDRAAAPALVLVVRRAAAGRPVLPVRASNVGSFVGLLAYPFLIEPRPDPRPAGRRVHHGLRGVRRAHRRLWRGGFPRLRDAAGASRDRLLRTTLAGSTWPGGAATRSSPPA